MWNVFDRRPPETEWDLEVGGWDVTGQTEAVWSGAGTGQYATTESQVGSP